MAIATTQEKKSNSFSVIKLVLLVTCIFVGVNLFDAFRGDNKYIGRWVNVEDPREVIVFYPTRNGINLQIGDADVPFNAKEVSAEITGYRLHFTVSREYFGFLGRQTLEMTQKYTGSAGGNVGAILKLPEYGTTHFRKL